MGDTKTLEERVSRIEKIFWVAFIVAAIFGVGGAWGAKVLNDARSELSLLSRDIKTMNEKISKAGEEIDQVEKTISEQEQKSIIAVRKQEELSIMAIEKQQRDSEYDLDKKVKDVTNQVRNSMRNDFNKLTSFRNKLNTKQVFQKKRGGLPLNGRFDSNGGKVILFASGTGWRSGNGYVGMEILVDGQRKGSSMFYSMYGSKRARIPAAFVVVDDLSKGSHTVTLKSTGDTMTSNNDFFDVIVIELP